jgi:hypothetical protein
VARPKEYGDKPRSQPVPQNPFDAEADSLEDLAVKLGA